MNKNNIHSLFEILFNNSEGLVCITDLSGNIIRVNQEWLNMFGNQELPLKFVNFVVEIDRELWNNLWDKFLLENKDTVSFASRLKSKNEDEISVEWEVFKYGDLFLCKGTEKSEVIPSLENCCLLLDQYVGGILAVNRMGELDYVNKVLCNWLGYQKEELVNLNISKIDSVYKKDNYNKRLLECIDKKSSFRSVFKRKDGTELPVEMSVFQKKSDERSSFLLFVRDITEIRESEDYIKKLKASLDAFSDAVYWGNFEYGFDYVNKAACDMLGYSKEEFKQLKIFDLDKDFKLNDSRIDISEYVDNKQNQNAIFKAYHTKKNGERIPVEVISTYVWDNDEGFVLSFVRDISERKKYQQDLIEAKEHAEQSDRLKSAFLANLSHEIRTPMNAIIGFSTFLKDVDISREDHKMYTDIIISSGEHLLSLINDIIDISKIDSGQVDISKTNVNINHLLREIFDLFQSVQITKNKTHIEILLDVPDEEIIVYTDEMRLRQILLNLIGNALKFTEEGFVKICYKLENGFLNFSIQDTGIGITEDKKDIIFERFQQGADSTEKLYGGTGLGLAIAKACVQLLGGEISFTSEPGVGSVFYFSIKV